MSTFCKSFSWIDTSSPSWEISFGLIPQNLTNKKSILVQGNSLVLPENKTLPQPMFTPIYFAIWGH